MNRKEKRMNKVLMMGRLTKDVVCSVATNGTKYARFSIAIDRGKDQNGNSRGADYPSIIAFGNNASNLALHTRKGCRVMVEGRFQTGSYKNQQGTTVYYSEVAAERVRFIDFAKQEDSEEAAPSDQAQIPDGFYEADDDGVPF